MNARQTVNIFVDQGLVVVAGAGFLAGTRCVALASAARAGEGPEKGERPGKVTLNLQNRTVELEAFTAAAELPTGTPVRVVAVLGPSSVEVTHATSEA